MKKVLLLTVVLMFGASLAFAQGGVIGAYADNAGTACDIITGGITQVYLVHTLTSVKGVQFRAPEPPCFTGYTLLAASLNPSGVPIGNYSTGLAMGFAACQPSPLLVVTLTYLPGGTATPCCLWPVLPDANIPSGQIEIVDCVGNLVYGLGAINTMNSDGNCTCEVPLPTEESTWGKVKSLYSN